MSDELIQIETPFAFNEENQREFDELIGRYPIKEAAMLPTLHIAQRQGKQAEYSSVSYIALCLAGLQSCFGLRI